MGARAARRVSPLDWLMVAIAVGSVALLLLATFGGLPVRQQLLIFWVDVGVCVVFALDFFVRWRRAGWGLAFVLRNWYEVLGMLPISHPALHSLRWLRIVVMLARLGRA